MALSTNLNPILGVRERKKAETRASIQHYALTLFAQKGYEATTVEEIAVAASITRRTFFRYFKTKEGVVFDSYGSHAFIISALSIQPIALTPLQALRQTLCLMLQDTKPQDLEIFRKRLKLIFSEPALQVALSARLNNITDSVAKLIAKRTGKSPEDFEVRIFVGAFLGVISTLEYEWASSPDVDFADSINRAVAFLESGLRL